MAIEAPGECPSCGLPHPDDAPSGPCPRCLLRAGLDTDTTPPDPATGTGSVLDAILSTVGPTSRVMLRDADGGPEPPLVHPAEPATAARYRIDGKIAEGGMGAVFRGRDPDLGRDVALKVLLEDLRDDADLVRRFVEEAQIGGQLQHPGIVPIYELGSLADLRPFFAMKLVKGQTLFDLLDGRTGPDDDLPRFLSIFEAIAQTVAYAHARGVIHRDLKPSNVMVGSFGEVQVMDWGLAKVLPRGGAADDARAGQPAHRETVIATARSQADETDWSRPGSALGTPAYMAPEQARGEIDQIDERADVFALGSILCEVLTGSPAFSGRSGGEILRKAALGDLADATARLDACAADPELVDLARSCLAREREDRPRHAGSVAERMTRHLAGVQERLRAAEVGRASESARAEEATRTAAEANERARAERRARRFQVGLAASLLALTTFGGLGFTYWLQQRQARASRFALAFAETTTLRDKARREVVDPALWREALAALKRVEGQDPEPRIDALRAEIEDGLLAAERVARLRQDLVEVRANRQDVGHQGTDFAYAAAFRAAGLDLDALGAAEFARRLTRQPKAVAVELSAFLDEWSAVRREVGRPVAFWRGPIEAARATDTDPYRDRLRVLLLAEDRRPAVETLRALAAAPESADLPAPTAALLSSFLMAANRSDEAATLLRNAVARHPGDVWVNHTLAQILELQHPAAREEAVRYYTAARALRPETAHGLAHLLDGMGRGAEAEAVFRDLANRRPDNPGHLGCLGGHLENRGRVAEAAPILERAAAAYREVIRLRPDHAEAHAKLGDILKDQGKFKEADAEYREAIRLRPDRSAIIYANLGVSLSNQRKHEEAVAAYLEAIRREPDRADFYLNLGGILGAQGKSEEAVAAFREAIRLQPDLAEARAGLGGALIHQGKPDEAIAAGREAIRLKPDNAEAHTNLGIALADQGKPGEAVVAHREAIRLRPNYAEAHVNLGNALAKQGKLDEAVAEYRAAIRLKPDLDKAHSNLGVALADQGKPGEAVVAHREAIRLRPDDAGFRYNNGVALKKQGKPDEAVAEYREAIRLNPGLDGAHLNLSDVLLEQGRLAEAVAACRAAIRLRPDHAEAHVNLGVALERQEKRDEAIAEYRQAIRLKPDLVQAHNNLGHTLEYLGRVEEAVAELRRAVELAPPGSGMARLLPGMIRKLERRITLAERLPALLKGEDKPANAAEGLVFARICYDKGLHVAAARLWTEALAAQPNLVDDPMDGHRYSAACCAALAAAGKGKDVPPPDDDAKAKLRAQALALLQADLPARAKQLEAARAKKRSGIIGQSSATPEDMVRELRHLQADADLAGVRDADALATLPEAERASWRDFWADLDALLKHVGAQDR